MGAAWIGLLSFGLNADLKAFPTKSNLPVVVIEYSDTEVLLRLEGGRNS
tara:strand:- start:362 stop:508 length:147 start_codon:yes stop_codon:yes gene_type:complete